MKYAHHLSDASTPQNEPVPGKPTVPNSAGGYAFAVDDWVRLGRFLILGCEGGSYYATERTLTRENAEAVALAKGDGVETVRDFAHRRGFRLGRALKNDPRCSPCWWPRTPTPLEEGARPVPPSPDGTHLFQFARHARRSRGGDRVSDRQWAAGTPPSPCATVPGDRTSSRRWSHRDLLRLAQKTTNRRKRSGGWSPTAGCDGSARGQRHPESDMQVIHPAVDVELPPLCRRSGQPSERDGTEVVDSSASRGWCGRRATKF